MPGKHVDSDPSAAGRPCQRCRISEASIIVRAEPLCRDCFVKYVNTKAIKRMESYAYYVKNRSANEERKLLLPVSFGVSSVTLLYLLDEHLKRQTAKSGRTGYALHVLFVDTAAVERDVPGTDMLDKLKEAFPGHEYSSVALADIFESSDAKQILQEMPEVASAEVTGEAETPQERLERLILSLPSATSRSDVITILKNRLVVSFAQKHGCKGILWGDSTTKIAGKTLAETAKGRGFSLPWQVSDGMSPFGIAFNYPLRDLLKKELVAHAQVTVPPLTGLIHADKPTQASASAKNTTIDDLMKQYFESVEQEYPSIVANVVRTSSKLEPGATEDDRCQSCHMPVAGARFGIHGWGGDQQDAASMQPGAGRLCYGCTRAVPQSASLLPDELEDVMLAACDGVERCANVGTALAGSALRAAHMHVDLLHNHGA
ncbi:thiouridylase cytoplasmic subunit 2 [Diplodia corticola]|uniref:Cytoplasmic tRNA 2-thiolation protein 2 n=1 Tax=Diplodia corticola TaxID=236234 RepID=A0A1J9QRX6_9PEZI|nr:thiouridylase cytoplasmic subunit 2 [Diplodia corticola]OJD31177.1 thiouridylase cytoplasmic subunit 2 [Diplodia corticola]